MKLPGGAVGTSRHLCLPLLLFAVAAAQSTGNLASNADALIRSSGFRGSVLLAKGGKVLLARGYDLANVELNVPNRPETKFRLGSITKQFTAAAILQLQEEGNLKVTDEISRYIPAPPAAWKGITIHHLLTHTSGIPSYTDGPSYEAHMREPAGDPLRFIDRFRNLPLAFRPGARFQYDNSGYFLLGVIIQQVSGESYEQYLRKHIFDPLGMADSGYDWPQRILPNRAAGYAKNRSGEEVNADFLDMGQPFSAGSLYSTVLDLYKWDRALYTTRVLRSESIRAAYTDGKYDWGPGIKYGYGWGITQIHGHKVVGHGGGINGFATVIWRAIEEDSTVIVLSNHEDTPVSKLGKELLEMLVTASR
jgi:CubicO group peptidase (beta-lactamase class C family)